jgi:hypothetical protein
MPYTAEELIQAALAEDGPGTAQTATARKRRRTDQPPNNRNPTIGGCLSRKQGLSSDQERFVARWCLKEHEAGRTPRRADIKGFAQRILNNNRKAYLRLAPNPLDEDFSRPTRQLGEHWVDRFLKRYPAVKKIMRDPAAVLREDEVPHTPPPGSDEDDGNIPTPQNSRHLREIIRGLSEPLPRDIRLLFRNMGKLMAEKEVELPGLLAENDRLRMERRELEAAKAEDALEEDEDLELEEGVKTEADVADIKVEESVNMLARTEEPRRVNKPCGLRTRAGRCSRELRGLCK